MSDLNKAIQIALEAHSSQTDKAGLPYILHPIRLMLKFHSEDEMIVAVLHDVIEDSSMTLDALKQHGFSDHIIDAIACLTSDCGVKFKTLSISEPRRHRPSP